MEGFPRTADECQYLIQNGYFPDVALFLDVDENDVINRLLPSRMQLWKERRSIHLLKKAKIKERKKEMRVNSFIFEQ